MEQYQFIISTIKKAGEMLKKSYHDIHDIQVKGGDPRNIVTDVDIKINGFLTNEIKKHYPEDAVHSEEKENSASKGGRLWTLDPIDGTANFSRRIPHFSICIGLTENKTPLTGAVFNPITDELFSFQKNKGAFLNGKLIKVSKISELLQASIFMVTGKKKENRDWGAGLYRKLLDQANKTRMFGSSALDLCFLADGRIDGVVYGQLSAVDISVALGILAEAGGKITGERGDDVGFSVIPQKIVASNGTEIHDKLLALIA